MTGTPWPPGSDYLGLSVALLPLTVRKAWNAHCSKARRTDSSTVPARLTANSSSRKVERALFRSLCCPPALGSASEADAVLLVKRLVVLELDFENDPRRMRPILSCTAGKLSLVEHPRRRQLSGGHSASSHVAKRRTAGRCPSSSCWTSCARGSICRIIPTTGRTWSGLSVTAGLFQAPSSLRSAERLVSIGRPSASGPAPGSESGAACSS
jgi:hypothetical protein